MPSFKYALCISNFYLCKTCEYNFVLNPIAAISGEEDFEPVELVSADLGDANE